MGRLPWLTAINVAGDYCQFFPTSGEVVFWGFDRGEVVFWGFDRGEQVNRLLSVATRVLIHGILIIVSFNDDLSHVNAVTGLLFSSLSGS
jgi:hypothetical protein